MEKGYIVARIKEIISRGNASEACNHIELVLRKDIKKYNNYIIIKNELKRTLDESLLNVISVDEKLYKINNSNRKLLLFLSDLEDKDFYDSINPTKTDSEILEQLRKKHRNIDFTINQQKAIHQEKLKEKEEQLKKNVAETNKQLLKLKNKINNLKEINKNLGEKNQNLLKKIDRINKERERLKKIISEEYAKKKIWK